MKYQIDQIAIYVGSRDEKIEEINDVMGTENWVRDEVESDGKDGWNMFGFNYDLAFNYSILKGGIEFELIERIEGMSYHNGLIPPCISHFGSHVKDLDEAVEYFEDKGFPEIQRNNTTYHSNADGKYKYAFVDTRPIFGYVLKLIERVKG